MENIEHPSLALTITNGQILGPDGVVGYVDYGESYVYVCFFNNKLIVAEHNTFDSIITRCVENRIRNEYYYAFKIICGGEATAVVECLAHDIRLVGVMSGFLANGIRLWQSAETVTTWPGLRSKDETGRSSKQ